MSDRRVETVLRVRALRERVARAQVAQRRQVLNARRHDEVAAWAAVRTRSSTRMLGAGGFVAHRAMLGAGVYEATAAGDRVTAADGDVTAAMSTWRDEARRLDGIERLVERIRAEEAFEAQRLEYNELDDLVVMRRGHTDGPER